MDPSGRSRAESCVKAEEAPWVACWAAEATASSVVTSRYWRSPQIAVASMATAVISRRVPAQPSHRLAWQLLGDHGANHDRLVRVWDPKEVPLFLSACPEEALFTQA